jgi:hypothetical protein
LIVRAPILGARRRQQRREPDEQDNQSFHAGMLIQRKPAWQMITAELAVAGLCG